MAEPPLVIGTGPTVGPPGNGGVPGVFTGGSAVGQFISLISTLFGDLNDAITRAGNTDYPKLIADLQVHAGKWGSIATLGGGKLWQMLSDLTVGEFYREMLEAGLGVNVDAFDPLARQGVETTNTMLGFATVLPWVVAAISIPAKLLLGERWGDKIMEPIAGLPEEMGISWVLGTSIEKAFDAAVGASIEEGIAEQKRPTRLDWPILRQAWRQGLLHEADLRMWLAKLGYPQEQINYIASLDLHQLPTGDLQQLWLYDIIDGDTLEQELRAQGWTDQEAGWLRTLYVDKSQTAAGAEYRSTARSLFADYLISEDQYRTILSDTHFPPKEIEDDIASVHLIHDNGRLHPTLTAIKTAYLKQHMSAQWAHQQLEQLGYTPEAQVELVKSWDLLSAPRPMSLAKSLSYYAAGILDRAQATTRLHALNLTDSDIAFYLAHPTSVSGVRLHQVTPALIGQAFLDGAIQQTNLIEELEKAGASPQMAKYMRDVLVFRQSRQKRPAHATVPLSAAQILDALEYGLLDAHQIQTELEHLGYSEADALLLMEIKLKGQNPFAKSPPPAFNSVQDALNYLRGRGFTLQPPPNPLDTAAEQIVEQAGWIAIPPAPGTLAGSPPGAGGQAP